MESTSLPQEDAAMLALRRRRKKLIAIFSTFLFSVALIIAALITFLIHDITVPDTFDRTTTVVDPSLQAFCSVVNSTPSCLASFYPVIYTKRVTNPNQIFSLSLETASQELQTLISLLSNSSTDRSNLSGCSNSLREALNQINGTFSLVDQLQDSGFQRDGMMNRIEAAEEDLKACAADGLGKQVEEKVERAKMFLGYSIDFLYGYDAVWMVSDADKYHRHWHRLLWELEENVFAFVMFGLQLFFLGFLVWSLFCIVKYLTTRSNDMNV